MKKLLLTLILAIPLWAGRAVVWVIPFQHPDSSNIQLRFFAWTPTGIERQGYLTVATSSTTSSFISSIKSQVVNDLAAAGYATTAAEIIIFGAPAGNETDWTSYNPPLTSISSGSFREFVLNQVAITWTNLSTYAEAVNGVGRTHIDLSGFTDFRYLSNYSAAAVTGDVQIHCSDVTGFSPQTLMIQFDNPTANALLLGAWTAIPAGCKTAGGVYVRVGMLNGNGTEDPTMRFTRIQVR